MKTQKDVEGQLKRLVGNTGMDNLHADFNSTYGGWILELADKENIGCIIEDISVSRLKTSDFYYMLNGMNRLIERMRTEKKIIQ